MRYAPPYTLPDGVIHVVPPGFDPRQALLVNPNQHGLVPPPDAVRRPAGRRFWEKFYGPGITGPLTFIPGTGAIGTGRGAGHKPAAVSNKLKGAPRREAGKAWSGAYITPRGGQMFTAVFGEWQVPQVQPPASVGMTPVNGTVTSCSTWIGLDGARRYLHSSLPQIGTRQFVENKDGVPVVSYHAWWQWWCEGYRSEEMPISLPLTAGDVIMCAIVVNSDTQVTFHIKNHTTGIAVYPRQVAAPSLPLPGTVPASVNSVASGSLPESIQRRITGATAEWITERPSDPGNNDGKQYTLANYGEVLFENCIATVAATPDAPDPSEQNLRGATLRDMMATDIGLPPRLISVARLQGNQDEAVVTCYQGP